MLIGTTHGLLQQLETVKTHWVIGQEHKMTSFLDVVMQSWPGFDTYITTWPPNYDQVEAQT